ncbi:MAG: nucleoside monophosphate kinase [Candidatus Paceibacterota bacterium]|jgi:adenylate kinase
MDKKPLIIILLGKSGSGKGTQVNLIAEKYGLKKIGSGELLRQRKKQEDFSGSKISTVIDNGGIIPTPVIFKLWMDKLEEFKKGSEFEGIIFDGSPRKIKEAYLMDEALEWYEWNENVKVILIDISDEEVVKRIASRAGLEDRPEDSPEGIKKRLAWFEAEVVPVINYYKENNRLITINGEQSIEKVFNDIENSIK